jgi:hypothetical protein
VKDIFSPIYLSLTYLYVFLLWLISNLCAFLWMSIFAFWLISSLNDWPLISTLPLWKYLRPPQNFTLRFLFYRQPPHHVFLGILHNPFTQFLHNILVCILLFLSYGSYFYLHYYIIFNLMLSLLDIDLKTTISMLSIVRQQFIDSDL